MEKGMLDGFGAIPGVEAVALTEWTPLGVAQNDAAIFGDKTTDLRAGNTAGNSYVLKISPDYFRVARTSLLSGRTFTWQDDKDAPRVAVINQEFARKIFGSVTSAMGGYFTMPDGTRIQVVGVSGDGSDDNLTEEPCLALFFPPLQFPRSDAACSRRGRGAPSNCWGWVRRQDWAWEFWQVGCWLASCIWPIPAFRWCWRAWFWQWRFWAWRGCGFPRDARCQ